jgi:DNA-binding beta-propeller fold protein YncE
MITTSKLNEVEMLSTEVFKSPCKHPNGLQWTNKGLYVLDQELDDIYVLDEKGNIDSKIQTITENGSGITVGGGFIWTASNGETQARSFRKTDTHKNLIYKLDIDSGEYVDSFPTPDGGGVHGLEWDNGLIWVTAFNPKAIYKMNSETYKVEGRFLVDEERLHGLVRQDEGIWCAHTSTKKIIKYNVDDGSLIEEIQLDDDDPYPHGMSIKNNKIWISDANFGGKQHSNTLMGKPSFNTINL